MVDVRGSVTLRTIVGVVEVELSLVAAKAIILGAHEREVIVGAKHDRFTVTGLDHEGRRNASAALALTPCPDAVRLLRREGGVESRAVRYGRQGGDVAHLREELIPALVGKKFARWTSLNRATLR